MSSAQSQKIVRSTVANTWKWLWPDVLMRIVPMMLVPFLYIFVLHLPLSFLGLVPGNWPLQIVAGLFIGVGMATFATVYRMTVVGPWFRWPTKYDHLLQTFYYLFINGPVEELFFRGFLLAAVGQWTGNLFWGWLVSTILYTLYHRLGKWSWRSVAGVGLAGLVFSIVYLFLPGPRSLIAVVIIHGFTTSGFLNWGDEAMYRYSRRKLAGATRQIG
ncbi:MAG TPA: CPBP family intramembrane glutamic endopeptidase [Ktedonobacteraceae bacterium]|nr:CPBP family intramembrane glutamic endopeptidase [Ktedonobacteraceae bacterium]